MHRENVLQPPELWKPHPITRPAHSRTHTHCLMSRYLTSASWQPHLSSRSYLQRSIVRLHQGRLQALAHVANQGGCRLNYGSTSRTQDEQKHMRRRRWFNERIKHISTLAIKRLLHRHLHVVRARNSPTPAFIEDPRIKGFFFSPSSSFLHSPFFPWDVSFSLRPGSLLEIRTGKAFFFFFPPVSNLWVLFFYRALR